MPVIKKPRPIYEGNDEMPSETMNKKEKEPKVNSSLKEINFGDENAIGPKINPKKRS